MVKIRYSDEFICPKCGRHTALVCHKDGAHQAHCMICDAYYDVEIAKATHADRLRAMSDEELAVILAKITEPNKLPMFHGLFMNGEKDVWLDWLKQEATE